MVKVNEKWHEHVKVNATTQSLTLVIFIVFEKIESQRWQKTGHSNGVSALSIANSQF